MATQEIRELSRDVPFPVNGTGQTADAGLGFTVLRWIGASGSQAPTYWSYSRDVWLRQFYLRSDYLKIAVSTFVQKAYAVPLTIAPRDRSVKSHVALAEQMHTDIMYNSGLLKGFQVEFAKFATDYATQDNGAFMLIMGPGKADGPIRGQVTGLMHLDALRCIRTGNLEFPVIYEHAADGKQYKLHYTRIIYMSSMPSADADMLDVGLCGVSRCIDAVQDLLDVTAYTSEKLGSRPARQILYAKTGTTIKQLQDAMSLANTRMDAQGLERFARTMMMAPQGANGNLELDLIDLASAPDGFDREKVTIIDVAVIAAAFGLDTRDLAHSFGITGQTKADAEVQDRKRRGKGIEQFLSDFTWQINQKVLPEPLEAYFDYVDDTQDEQAAAIRKTRAEGRQIDLATSTITVRVAREQMLEGEEITEQQFEDMELAEGRLPDGLDVLMLFQSQDREIMAILGGLAAEPPTTELPAAEPVATEGATPAPPSNLTAIEERRRMAWERHDNAPNANIKRKMRQALAALDRLQGLHQQPAANESQTPPQDEEQPADDDESLKAKEAIKPRRGGSLPSIPSEDKIAADAETNADVALRSWDEAMPEYAGLLDAAVSKKKELKQSDRFSYDEVSFRYRDKQTGRFISEDTIRSLAQQYESTRKGIAPSLASRLVNNEISVQQWTAQMRSELRDTYSSEYMLGRGGRNAMTQADWGRVGNMLRNQYGYLDSFAADIAAGNLSEAQIAARAAQYFNSATQAYERGKTVGARGMPSLPAYPGDGGTVCGSNCKCSWDISETKLSWNCTWRLSDAEHCPGCVSHSSEWSPLVVPKDQ